MTDDEAPRATADRGDAGPGAARSPGAVAGETQEEKLKDERFRAGWARPINSRKWHFFKAEDTRSICGRWMYFGNRPEPEGDDHPENCAACRKAKAKAK